MHTQHDSPGSLVSVRDLTFTYRDAHAPNLTIEVHKRTFLVGKKASVRVSLYNLRSATLAAYPVKIEELIPDATTVAISDSKNERGLE